MEVIRFCGAAILGTVAALLLRQTRGELSAAVRAAAILCLFGGGIVMLAPILARVGALANASLGEDAGLLLASVAVAVITRICGECCRALGESAVADALDFVGRAALLGLALPLLERLIDAAVGLMG